MRAIDQDNEAATGEVDDRGESVGAMEPLVLEDGFRQRERLNDLAIELASASAGFRRSLPAGVAGALADLVRSMTCYYSNLIEGHYTHPVDIELAMKEDLQRGPRARGVLASSSTRTPLLLTFPATLATRWMPGLFPDLPVA